MNRFLAIILSFITIKAVASTDVKNAYKETQNNKAVFVDVREQDEVKDGMIQGAIWFPLSRINNDEKWIKDFQKLSNGKKVYLYCRSGNRSGKVMEILKNHGIKSENIGGFEALKKELSSP